MWQKEHEVVVFEPTLREVEMLTQIFDEITWIGFGNSAIANANSRGDRTGKIRFHVFKMQGGSGMISKLKLALYFPYYIFIIVKYLSKATYVHTRAPSVPAFIAIVISLFDRGRKYWHKFAGNWMEAHPPKSYLLQKKLMLRASATKGTVNGQWDNMPPHIYAFENPCFTEAELHAARQAASVKRFDGKLTLLFVGRIEYEKGVGRVIEALKLLNDTELNGIEKVLFIGKGKDWDALTEQAKTLKVAYEFTGTRHREELEKLYATSHIFLLPSSASEGFPKVIAEAAAFACMPMVSSVSSITQYVHDSENGVVYENLEPATIAKQLSLMLGDRNELTRRATAAVNIADLYTYERYNQRISSEIFNFAE
jgi:glycosyltransferase involved in cell wall biosynthesis